MTGPLDRHCQRPLMPRAGAKLSAWLDLAPLRQMASETRDILVIDRIDPVCAEHADFAARLISPAATASARAPAATTALSLIASPTLSTGTEPRSAPAVASAFSVVITVI